MTKEINIAFGFDSQYVPHAAAVVSSIVRQSGDAGFHFVILHDAVERRLQITLEALAPSSRFSWIDVEQFELPDYQDRDYISRASLNRFGLETLAPEDCDRVIYLDADLIVTSDLRELWNVDLQGAAIGAVADVYSNSSANEAPPFWQSWNLPKGRYFNSGVLLIDLKQVRAGGDFTRALDFVAEHGKRLPYRDQDALNWIYWNKWHPLPPKWNVQTQHTLDWFQQYLSDDMRLGAERPGIVHYTGWEKPWTRQGFHPWWWLYWEALGRTQYLNQVADLHGASRSELAKLWLRWLRRRPAGGKDIASFPSSVFQRKAPPTRPHVNAAANTSLQD